MFIYSYLQLCQTGILHKSNNVGFFPVRNFRKHNISPSVNICDISSNVKFLTSHEIPENTSFNTSVRFYDPESL